MTTIMIIITRTIKIIKKIRKKKTKKQSEENANNIKINAISKSLPMLKIEDLNCCVCMELPKTKIYQCSYGHFLCQDCYRVIRDRRVCECPICRVHLSRRQAARNRLAERWLASTFTECENTGCKEKIQFAALKEHVENECPYRMVNCKYSPLGCDWSGIAKNHKQHQCNVPTQNVATILNQVLKINEDKQKQMEKEKEEWSKYIDIAKLWETRCRNVVGRDIIIDNGQNDLIVSHSFHVLGEIMELQFQKTKATADEKKLDNNLQLQVRLHVNGQPRHRLFVQCCILKGPDFSASIPPFQFECHLTRAKPDSEWFPYPMSEDLVNKFVNATEPVNLRVMIVDKRAGDVSSSFRVEADHDDAYSEDLDDDSNLSNSSTGDEEYTDSMDEEEENWESDFY